MKAILINRDIKKGGYAMKEEKQQEPMIITYSQPAADDEEIEKIVQGLLDQQQREKSLKKMLSANRNKQIKILERLLHKKGRKIRFSLPELTFAKHNGYNVVTLAKSIIAGRKSEVLDTIEATQKGNMHTNIAKQLQYIIIAGKERELDGNMQKAMQKLLNKHTIPAETMYQILLLMPDQVPAKQIKTFLEREENRKLVEKFLLKAKPEHLTSLKFAYQQEMRKDLQHMIQLAEDIQYITSALKAKKTMLAKKRLQEMKLTGLMLFTDDGIYNNFRGKLSNYFRLMKIDRKKELEKIEKMREQLQKYKKQHEELTWLQLYEYILAQVEAALNADGFETNEAGNIAAGITDNNIDIVNKPIEIGETGTAITRAEANADEQIESAESQMVDEKEELEMPEFDMPIPGVPRALENEKYTKGG